MSALNHFHPAPEMLATPTDLKPFEVHAVVAALNPLIADAVTLFFKYKNFHWHVYGPHFRDYHLLFEEQAVSVFGAIDVLAERVRMLGGTTLHNLREVIALKTLVESDDPEASPEEMFECLIRDNCSVAMAHRTAIGICEANRDTATANILQSMLDATEKRIWFLYEVSQPH